MVDLRLPLFADPNVSLSFHTAYLEFCVFLECVCTCVHVLSSSVSTLTGFLLRLALAGTMAFIAGTTCPDRITVRHIAMVLTVINVINT